MFFAKTKINAETDRIAKLINYLENHYHYGDKIANKVKFYELGLTSQQIDLAYNLIYCAEENSLWDRFMLAFEDEVDDFTSIQNRNYTISSDGRSGGYLCLYECQEKALGYRSRCAHCGQLSYKSVLHFEGDSLIVAEAMKRSGGIFRDENYLVMPTIQALTLTTPEKVQLIRTIREQLKIGTLDSECGVCHKPTRVNLTQPVTRIKLRDAVSYSQIMEKIEEYHNVKYLPNDNDEKSDILWSLRHAAEVIYEFDIACDYIRDNLIHILDHPEETEEN